MKGIARHGYKDTDISQIEVMHVFECETEDDALTMENVLRKFYKAKANSIFVPNDRFENIEFNKEEIENNSIIQSQYNLCKETFQGAKLAPFLPGPKIQFKYNLGVDILLDLWYYNYRKKKGEQNNENRNGNNLHNFSYRLCVVYNFIH